MTRSSCAQPIRASARATFEVRQAIEPSGRMFDRAPRAVGQLPRERVLRRLLDARVVAVRPQLAEQVDLPQRPLVLLVVLGTGVVHDPSSCCASRIVATGGYSLRRSHSAAVAASSALAEERAAREHRHRGVLGLEQPVDRLGGDLGQDARMQCVCIALTSEEVCTHACRLSAPGADHRSRRGRSMRRILSPGTS